MKTRKARRCTALLSLALILCLLLGTTALAAENPFHDVNSSDYFYEPVLWAVENGVTAGVTPTSFAPNAPCTRGQTVAFLWRALGKPTPQKTENPFTDVAASAYYYTPVLWAVEKGVTYGISATQFGPEATVTRSQVVTFLWRAAGSPAAATSTNPFTDVRASEYYYKAVLWAAEKSITAGVTPTSFAPNAPCTRAQIVSFLHRYITKVVSPAPLPLTIVQQPQSSTVAPGEIFQSMHISVSGGKAPYVYRAEGFDTGSNTWIDVATSEPTTQTSWDPGLTARDKPGSANYHIIVTDANGDRVVSEEVTLSVSGGPLHITAHPSNATVQPGEMLTTLNIQVSGGVPDYYYYQAEMYVEGTGWKLLGEHESVYTQWKFNGYAPTTAGTYRYRISVTDSSGTKVTSNEAIITVTVEIPLTIVQQPQSSTVAPGEIFQSMHISVSGGKAPYVYRAEGFDTGSNTWIDVATSEPTTQTSWDPGLTARDKPGSANYHIIVTDANGDRVVSEEVTLSVSGGPLHITAHPSNATVQPGEMLTTLNIQVSGGVPDYYYYQAEMYVEGTGWKLLGEHESVYTQWKFNGYAPTTAGTYRYRISVTDSSGTKVTSNEAIITVKSDLRITAHPTGATVTPNSKLTTLNLSIADGIKPYHYVKEQYYEGRGWTITAEHRDATFTTWNSGGTAPLKAGTYRYRLTATDASGTKVTSNEATITVKSDLRITAHPTNATVSPGNYLNTLKITIAGGVAPYFYRVEEYKNDMWSGIHGQQNVTDTTWTTTLYAPMTEGTYRYRITVQDDSGTIVTSNAAVITVKSRLRITAHPTGATVAPNSKLTTLNISIADGIKPYHYVKEQYYEGRGWMIIAEHRDATFTTWNSGGAASSKPGTYRYRLTVTDASGGKVISNEATITVKGN